MKRKCSVDAVEFMSDYEKAMRKAAKAVWPKVKVNFLNFRTFFKIQTRLSLKF